MSDMQRVMQKSNKGIMDAVSIQPAPTWLQNVTSNFTSTVASADIYPRKYPVTVVATSIPQKDVNVAAPPHPPAGLQPGKTCHKQPDQTGNHRKPNCSYTVLIGMALRTSETGALPVNEIYSYIQEEFPFFKTGGPDGWKSSIRHCLSVGYYFRKMVKDGSQGNKGFHWEVIPKKRAALDREIERFMEKKGKAKTDVTAASTVQTPFAEQKPTLPLIPMSQCKPIQSDDLLDALMQASSQSVNVPGTTASSASNAQVSISLDQLLSALASLDTTSLQNVLNNNLPAAATTVNTVSVAATSSIPQPDSAPVFKQTSSSVSLEKAPTVTAVPSVSRELPTHSSFTAEKALAISAVPSSSSTETVEKAHAITSVPSQFQLTTSIIPNSPPSPENPLPTQTALTATIQQSSTQQTRLKSDMPPAMTTEVIASSKFPILQPDVKMLKEIGMEPNTDIVSFANSLLTPTNLCGNVYSKQSPALAGSKVPSLSEDGNVPLCNISSDGKLEAVSPRSEDDIPLCNISSDSTDDKFEAATLSEDDRVPPKNTSVNGTDNEELHRQRLDYLKLEIDRATELYHSIHTTPQHATMDNGYGLSTTSADSFYSCSGMGRTMRHLRYHASQNFSMDPTYSGANITLTELNQNPLDFHPSATAHYSTSPLDSTRGILHPSNSVGTFVYSDYHHWSDPDHVAWQLQQDLDDFDEVFCRVTLAHEKESLKKRGDEKQCVEKVALHV